MPSYRVYFAFDYQRDVHRVRRIHELPDVLSRSAGGFKDSSIWRGAKRQGEASIRGLINDAMLRTDATVVCIGQRTAYDDSVNHEIQHTLETGGGLVGIKINQVPDQEGALDAEAPVPPLIEESGFNVYEFTDKRALLDHIREAIELAGLGLEERLERKQATAGQRPPPPERRGEGRQAVDNASVIIDGENYPVKNWNSRGLQAMLYAGENEEGDVVDIVFSVPLSVGSLEFECQATLIWVDNDSHEIGAVFTNLESDTRKLINRHFGKRL